MQRAPSNSAATSSVDSGTPATDTGASSPDTGFERFRIGSYTVTAEIGRGGYGEVFAAVHDVIGRDVAIKILHARWSDDADAVRRFVAEAQVVNAVRHPNIVDVIDFGTLEDGRQYQVMERLRGESLRARIEAREALSLDEALPILRAVAGALDAAHDAGIVHRDVKPENVFLHCEDDREVVKLIDFGLAKLAKQDQALTQSGTIMGTPIYMAPEQCRGQAVDMRTDVYAFGVLAYELLTGEVPLRGADAVATLLAHVHEEPTPPSKVAALPRQADDVLMPLLAKAPSERPARLAPVIEALGTLDRRSPNRRRSWGWLVLGIGAAAVAAVVGIGAMRHAPSSSPPRIESPLPDEGVAVRTSFGRPNEVPPPPIDAGAGSITRERISPERVEDPYERGQP